MLMMKSDLLLSDVVQRSGLSELPLAIRPRQANAAESVSAGKTVNDRKFVQIRRIRKFVLSSNMGLPKLCVSAATGLRICFWVLLLSLGFHGCHFLGRIFDISSGFSCSVNSLRKIDPGAFQSPLREGLQFLQFSMLGIQLAGRLRLGRK